MFLLVWVYNCIFNVKATKGIEGVCVGGVYFVGIATFGMVSGGCLNLATLIGPSLMSNYLDDWVQYLFSQLAGGLIGGILYKLILGDESIDEIDTGINQKKLVNAK